MGVRQEDLRTFEAETERLRKVRRHTRISYWKSAIRITACLAFIIGTRNPFFWAGSGGLLVAELLGIAEEVWGA